MSTNERIAKCRKIIKQVNESYLACDQNLKILLPLLYDEEVYSTWDRTEGVVGVHIIRIALLSKIITDMHAIMFDKHPKVASIRIIITALTESNVIKKVNSDFCKPIGVTVCGDYTPEEESSLIEIIQDEESRVKARLFSKALQELQTEFSAFENSDLVKKVNVVRDKVISHKQLSDTGTFTFKDFDFNYSDAKELVEQSFKIISSAYLLLENSSLALDSWTSSHTSVANTFWSKCKK